MLITVINHDPKTKTLFDWTEHMPNYPSTAYRRSSNPASFQGSGLRAANNNVKPPTPANDNWKVPTPANDNIPKGMKFRVPNSREFAKSVFKLGLATPLKYAGDIVGLYNLGYAMVNPDADAIQWVQGPYTTRCYAGGGGLSGLDHANSGIYPNLLYNVCPTGLQAVPGAPANKITSISVSGVSFMSDMIYTNPMIDRYTAVASWAKNAGAPTVAPRPHYDYGMVHLPKINPQVNPLALPIFQPVPLFKPVPQADVAAMSKASAARNAWISPTRTLPRPQIAPQPEVEPIVVPVSPLLPNQPAPRLQVYPAPRALPGRHRNAPPPKRTKERKFILAPLQGSLVGLAMNAVTESADFVDSLFYAIPVALRPHWPNGKAKKLGLTDKAYQVYKHFGDIDAQVAFKNLLTNQIGDTIGGIAGRMNAKALRGIYNKTGVNISTGLRRPHF